MTCREFADFIADYRSNALPADTRESFEQHLRICANCEKYLEIYNTTVALGKRAFEDEQAPIPPEIPDDLVNAILSARRKS